MKITIGQLRHVIKEVLDEIELDELIRAPVAPNSSRDHTATMIRTQRKARDSEEWASKNPNALYKSGPGRHAGGGSEGGKAGYGGWAGAAGAAKTASRNKAAADVSYDDQGNMTPKKPALESDGMDELDLAEFDM